jgi:hypothetical protein
MQQMNIFTSVLSISEAIRAGCTRGWGMGSFFLIDDPPANRWQRRLLDYDINEQLRTQTSLFIQRGIREEWGKLDEGAVTDVAGVVWMRLSMLNRFLGRHLPPRIQSPALSRLAGLSDADTWPLLAALARESGLKLRLNAIEDWQF